MAQFSYIATKEGKTVRGTAEATTKEALADILRKQSLHPLVIKPKSNALSFFDPKHGKKVKLKDLAVFTRQLATMIGAGVPLTRSLATLQEQTNNKYFRQVIADISKDVEGGITLGDAFAKFPRVFSDVYVSMVRAGEAGGILDSILARLASQVEQDSSMRKKIKSAMAYPTVILTITVIAFFGIMIVIIPKISKIIKDLGGPNAQLPVYTQVLLSISTFMQHNAIFIIIIFGTIIFFLRRYIRTPAGKYRLHGFLLRVPVLKTIITKIAMARFARTFSSLIGAGVGVLDALDVTGAAVGNKVIERELREAAEKVKNGKQLSEPLQHSPHFPMMISQMLAVGEETGKMDTVLIKVADFYEEEVSATIDALSSIIEPLMIIVLGTIVGVIAASVMGPIASLSKNIGT